MRGVFTAASGIASVSTQKTLSYITAPSTKALEIYDSSVTSYSSSNQQLKAAWQRITSLGAPSGVASVPEPHEGGDVSLATTVFNIANEPLYTGNRIGTEGFNGNVGWFFDPAPEGRITIGPNQSYGLRLLVTPGTAFDCEVRYTYREIG